MNWEEIFTSSNPLGGRMINVQAGVAGSEGSPYTSDNPSGGRCINVNIVSGGGGGSTGMLQIEGGVALDTTLRPVTDNSSTPVLSILSLSTTQALFGTSFTAGYYANTKVVVNNYASAVDEGANIGIFAASQATLNSATRFGYGLYGHGYTNGSARSGGVVGEGRVTATGDSGSAIGVRAYATDTHSGGMNIGLYGEASGGSTNYALYMNAGDIWSNTNQSWLFGSNIGLFMGGSTSVTASARLHVRGDGSNPIARFEDNAGTPTLRVENSLMRFGASTAFGSIAYAMTGTTFSGNNNGTGFGFYSQFSIAASSDRYDFGFGGDAVANDAGSVTHLALVRNFAAGAGSANYRPLGIYYTINNSGAQTGTATGIYTRATETNLNSMIHNLIDLGTAGLGSLFSVTNKGAIKVATIADADAPNSSLYYSSTASKLVWKDSGGVVNNLY